MPEIKKLVGNQLLLNSSSLSIFSLSNSNEVGLKKENIHWQKDAVQGVKDSAKELDECYAKAAKIKNKSARVDQEHECIAVMNNERVDDLKDNSAIMAASDIVDWSAARALYNVATGKDIDMSNIRPGDVVSKIKDNRNRTTKSYFIFNSADQALVLDEICHAAGTRTQMGNVSKIIKAGNCPSREDNYLPKASFARVDYDRNGNLNSLAIRKGTTQLDYVFNEKCGVSISTISDFQKSSTKVREFDSALCGHREPSSDGAIAQKVADLLVNVCLKYPKKSDPPASKKSVNATN